MSAVSILILIIKNNKVDDVQNFVGRDLILDRKSNEVPDKQSGMSGVGAGGFHVFEWAILKTKYQTLWVW